MSNLMCLLIEHKSTDSRTFLDFSLLVISFSQLPLISSVSLLSLDKSEMSPGNICLLIRLKTYVKKDDLIQTTPTTKMDNMVVSWQNRARGIDEIIGRTQACIDSIPSTSALCLLLWSSVPHSHLSIL